MDESEGYSLGYSFDEESQDVSNPSVENEQLQQSDRRVDYGIFIEAIQHYEYLYNLGHKLYKDSKKKAEAWKNVAQIVNLDVKDCVKVWKNLRDRFVKEKNKLSSGAGAPESNWPYFKDMLFYMKHTKPRETHTSTISTPVTRPSSSSSVENPVASPEFIVIHEEPIAGPSTETPAHRQQYLATPSSTAGQRKRKRPEEAGSSTLVDNMMGMASKIVTKFDEEAAKAKSPNAAFAQYVCAELEKMPENEAKKKRQKMLNILFEDF